MTVQRVPVVTWVATGRDESAATASLRRLAVDGEPVRWEVERVVVDPAHRRRDPAAEALRRVEQSARELGVVRLVVQRNLQSEAVLAHSRCCGRDLQLPVHRVSRRGPGRRGDHALPGVGLHRPPPSSTSFLHLVPPPKGPHREHPGTAADHRYR